jgi:hypothetical protein
MASRAPAEHLGDAATIARGARATLARRNLSAFTKQAIAAGVVHGVAKVEWGPHLDAHCSEVQLQLEGWLVAYGHGTPEMIARQRAAWERTGAVWEDGAPEPWLRYPLVQNALDNLPPGTLKSTITMVLASAWIWLSCPTFCFGAASGIDANVTRDSNATRDVVRSAWYRETFSITWTDRDFEPDEVPEPEDIEIRSDADSVSDWATTAGGRRYSRTVMRGFTGLHVDGLFCDDPDDADRVYNETYRVSVQNRWTRAMETRVNDEHRSIRRVIQQVVHVEGFTAYLLSIARWSPTNPKGWSRFCLAAEYGYGPEDAPEETPFGTRDWRTDKGQTLHPRISPGVLADKRLKLGGAYDWQYNQSGDRVIDGMFQRRHARWFVLEGTNVAALRRRPEGCVPRGDLPPIVVKISDLDRITLSVDAANSLDPKPGAKVSAVGLVVGGCRGEERFVLDDRTRVLGVSGTYRAIYELIGAWPLDRVLVEMKALGAGVVDELQRALRRGWYIDADTDEQVELVGPDGNRARCEIEPWSPPPREDKVQRAHGALPAWEQGLTFLLDGASWLYPQIELESRKTMDEGLIGELCSFPDSRRKDRVDSWSQFIARYRDGGDARQDWQAMGRLALVGSQRRR